MHVACCHVALLHIRPSTADSGFLLCADGAAPLRGPTSPAIHDDVLNGRAGGQSVRMSRGNPSPKGLVPFGRRTNWSDMVEPRAIKRFANRMRYLTADLSEDQGHRIWNLMTLGALDEVEIISSADAYSAGKARAPWVGRAKKAVGDLNLVQDWNLLIGRITEEDWEDYWSLASSVRFSRGPDAAEETAAAKS